VCEKIFAKSVTNTIIYLLIIQLLVNCQFGFVVAAYDT